MSDETSDHFMPLPEGVHEKLTERDRYLISFPRSGRTWLHRCLRVAQHAFQEGAEPDEAFIRASMLNRPVGKSDLNEAGATWENPFAKSGKHHGFLASHNWKGIPHDAPGPHLFLIRAPEDVLLSYYHYATFHGFLEPDKVSLSDFCKGNLPIWIAHTRTGIGKIETHPNWWMCLSYECLFSDPARYLSTIGSRIGSEVPPSICKVVARTMTPRFVEKTYSRNRPSLSARPGRGTTDLSAEILELVHTEAKPLYQEAVGLMNF